MRPDALETFMLELVNQERAARGLQPLAHSGALGDAASDHSDWMLATDTFGHSGRGGSTAGERMADAGYDFTGSWGWAENVGWYSLRGPEGLEDEVIGLHDGLMNSPGHRANILDDAMREIGIGLSTGDFEGWDAAMVTQNFARSGDDVFLTGVTIADGDGDGRYDIGEGRGGITITATNAQGQSVTAQSGAAGEYALPLDAGTYTVSFTDAGMETVTTTVTVGDENVKLDLTTADDAPSSRVTTRSDPDDLYGWNTVTTTRDAAGETLETRIVLDNGIVRTVGYEDGTARNRLHEDEADIRGWMTVEDVLTANGTLSERTVIADDGFVVSSAYADNVLVERTIEDGADLRSWATRTDTFDAAGNIVDTTFVGDDVITV